MGITGRAMTLLAVICSLTCAGCSFMFSEGPPRQPEKLAYFDCPATYAPVVADVSGAALMGAVAASALTTSATTEQDKNARTEAGAFTIGIGAVYLGSAAYGLVQTYRCREAKRELADRVNAEHKELLERRQGSPAPAATPTSPAIPLGDGPSTDL